MKYLAFDLGASSGKLFEAELKDGIICIEPVYSFPNKIVQLKDGMYWDFMNIYSGLCEGLKRSEARGSVDSLGIDSYNNDFGLIDANGELLIPVRSYRDPRTKKYWKQIFSLMSEHDVYMHSGNQIAPFNTLMHLAAMNMSGQHYLLENSHLLLMLPDLLGYYITNEPCIEYTLAAETELMNLFSREWIDEILNIYDIPRKILPRLQMPGTILGRSTAAFNAEHRLRGFDFVNVCEHDTASAFLASPIGRDAILISSGTWALVGVEHDVPVVNDFTYQRNIANEGGMLGHHRLLKNVMGSWLIQELKRDFALDGQEYSFADVQSLALAAESFRFPIDPDAEDFFFPGEMRRKIRVVSMRVNGRAPETPGEYFRCVYEALVMKYRYVCDNLERTTERHYDAINIIGGGCQDVLCNQFTANACNRRVLAGPIDASSIGNIAVQMIAHGELRDVEDARNTIRASFPMQEYYPHDSQLWDEMYPDYRKIFQNPS